MGKMRLIIIIVVLSLLGVGTWFIFFFNKRQVIVQEQVSSADNVSAQKLYEEASGQMQNRDLSQAKESYQKILNEHPDYENVQQVQTDLETLNLNIILSNTENAKAIIYEVQSGDSLGKIAKNHGVTIDLIKKSNNLKSDVIRIGQKLRIWQGQFNIYVDKSQNVLILKDGDEVVKTYNVSTGENNSTPVGQFKIVTKLVDPVWFKSGAVVPPESPQNELGTRWLGFDITGYGIHGTIHPESIGQQVTAGCVRMRNEEVEELYSIVPMSTPVTIVD